MTVTNICGTYTIKKPVRILGIADVFFSANPVYCGKDRTINFASENGHIPQYNSAHITGDTYRWQVSGGSFSFAGGTDEKSRYPQILFSSYGTYTVSVTYTNGCGTKTTSQQITFYEPVTVDAGPQSLSVCYSENTLTLNGAYAGPADSVRWQTSGTGVFNPVKSGNSVYTFSANDKSNGSVTLTLKAFVPAGSACASVTDNVVVTIKPRLYASAGSKTICNGEAVNHAPAANRVGATFSWTSVVSSGSVTGNGSGSGTINDVLKNVGTTDAVVTYTITPSLDGCTGESATYTVTVKPVATLTATPDKSGICSGDSIRIQLRSPVAGVVYSWTATAPSSVTGHSSASYQNTGFIRHRLVNSSTSSGTVTYTITAYTPNGAGGYCAGEQVVVSVPVAAGPTPANAGPDQKLCNQSSVTLAGNTILNGTGTWTQVSGPAGAAITSPTQPGTTVTGLAEGVYEFAWTVTSAMGCPGSEDRVVIYNRPAVTAARAGNDTLICDYETTPLSFSIRGNAPAHAAETGQWSVLSYGTAPAPVIPNAGSAGTMVSGIRPGVTKLLWTLTNDAGCTPSVDTLVITVFQRPVKGTLSATPATLCAGGSTALSLAGYTGQVVKWRLNRAPLNDNDYTDTLVATSSLQLNNLQDSVAVQVIVGSAGSNCALYDTARIIIHVDQPSVGGTTGSDATFCQGNATGTVQLSGQRGTIRWEASTDNGSSWTTVTGQTGTTLSYTNLARTTWYRAMVANGVCASVPSTITKITVVDQGDAAQAGVDQWLCNAVEVTLTGNTIAGAAYTWKQVAGPSATLSATSQPSVVVSGLQAGQEYAFSYSVSNGVCAASLDTVRIYNRPSVTPAAAGADTVICDFAGTALALPLRANSPAHSWEKGEWTILSNTTGAAPSLSSRSTAAATLNGVALGAGVNSGTIRLLWTISNDASCTPSTDTITIKVHRKPVAGVLAPGTMVCAVSDVALTLGGYTGQILGWRIAEAPFTGGYRDTSVTAASLRLLNLQDSVRVQAIVGSYGLADQCLLYDTATVLVPVSQPSLGGTTGRDKVFCQGSASGLVQLEGHRGAILWQQSTDNGANWTPISGQTGSTLPYANLVTTTWFRAAVTNGACTQQFSTITKITVVEGTGAARAGADQRLCNQASTQLAGSPTGNGFTYQWRQLPATTLELSDATQPVLMVSAMQPGQQYSFVFEVSNGICVPARDTVVIYNAAPLVNAINGRIDTLCKGVLYTTSSPAASGGDGTTPLYQWQSSADGVNFSDMANATGVSYSFRVEATTWLRRKATIGPCTMWSDTLKVVSVPAPPAAAAGADQDLCFVNRAELRGNAAGSAVMLWKVIGTTGAAIEDPASAATTVSNITPAGDAPVVHLFEYSITNGICPTTRDTVKLTVYPALKNRITPLQDTICSSQPVALRSAQLGGGSGTYTYQWQESADGVSFTDIPGQTGQDLVYTPIQSVYIRRYVVSAPCASYSDTARIVVQAAVTGNDIGPGADICINTAAPTITGSQPTGGDGNFRYQWEQSTNGTTWTDIPSAVEQDYTPGVLTQTTLFRRVVATSLCAGPQASASNTVTIRVNPNAKAVFTYTDAIGCPPFVITASNVRLQPLPAQNRQYEWYVEDSLIGTGTSFPGYTMIQDDDTITVKLKAISLYGCVDDSVSHRFYTYSTPRPSFVLSDTVGCGPLTVQVSNTTPKASLFTYRWDFGNGQTSTSAQPPAVVFQPNPTYGDTTYLVRLSVLSGCDTITVSQPVRVKSKPKALFAPSRTLGCSPMTVTFNNTSLGIGNTYTWHFGDGTTVTTAVKDTISHTYITAVRDTFYTKLVVTNECGSDSLRYAIVVSPNTIKLDFALNGDEQLGCAPHVVRFFNNSKGATTFRWDFGDGNVLSTTKNVDTVAHSYAAPGTYVVRLLAYNGCSDTSTTETITVFPRPKATFTVNQYTACLGDTLRFANSSDSATSYLWTFGDGNSSTLVNPQHIYRTPGNFTVVLHTFRVNAPGNICSDSAITTLQVVASRPGTFTTSGNIGSCAPFTVTFRNAHTPSVSAVWDFGDGTTATGDVVTHTYTRSGTFPVTLTATVPGGCTYESSQIVTVQGPSGELLYAGGLLCNAQSVRLEAKVSNTDTLVWNFGDGTTLRTTQRIVYHTYAQGGAYLPSVTLESSTGCSFPLPGRDTIRVDKIDAGFTFSQEALCGATNVVFSDTSHAFYGKTSVSWRFGDGTTGSGSTLSHTYTASGSYTVQVIVVGSSGCADTLSRPVSVVVNAIPTVNIIADPAGCDNRAVTLKANIVSADAVGLLQWTLSNGARSNSNPFALTLPPGDYTATVVVGTDKGCYDTAVHTLSVFPAPSIKASEDVTLCRGASTQLSVSGAQQYVWTPLQALSCTTCPAPVASPLQTTPYVVKGINSYGCYDEDTVVVRIIQPLDMTVSKDDSICVGGSAPLLASGATAYSWSPAEGLSSTTASNPVATPALTTRYRVVGYDGFNCFTDTAYVLVAVGGYPTVDLGPDHVLATGTMLPLRSVVQNGPIRRWEWSPATNLSCSSCPEPVAEIKKDMAYAVTVTSAYGCSATDTVHIKAFCENTQVFVPNAFTPDADGINDLLMVRGSGIVTVKSFRVFNRWGEVIFERSNFPPNNPAYGWDGRIRGVVSGPDVFVYTAEVVCENGVPFTYKGNVSILK